MHSCLAIIPGPSSVFLQHHTIPVDSLRLFSNPLRMNLIVFAALPQLFHGPIHIPDKFPIPFRRRSP